MKRGDIVIVAPLPPSDKPRPAVVVQSAMLGLLETVTVSLLTSDLEWLPGFRIPVGVTGANGLRKDSEVMIDLLVTVPLGRVRGYIGVLEPEVMRQVDAALRVYLGL